MAVENVVENMLKVRAAQQSGQTYDSVLAEELPQQPASALPPPTTSEVSYVISGNDAMIATRPAELAPVAPPPGLTMRGWSAEVTARHPILVAEAMGELAGEDGDSAADPIDPLDPSALTLAQRDLGFREVVANNLRVAAMQKTNNELSEGIEAAMYASPALVAARAAAVEEARAMAEGSSSGEPVPDQAPAPTTTTTTTKASSSTPAPSS